MHRNVTSNTNHLPIAIAFEVLISLGLAAQKIRSSKFKAKQHCVLPPGSIICFDGISRNYGPPSPPLGSQQAAPTEGHCALPVLLTLISRLILEHHTHRVSHMVPKWSSCLIPTIEVDSIPSQIILTTGSQHIFRPGSRQPFTTTVPNALWST